MNSRGLPAALLIVSVLLAVLVLAGCGGGGESGNGSRDGAASNAKEEKGDAGAANKGRPQANEDRPQVKIALGTIVATDPERKPNGRVVLRSTTGGQSGERMIFKLVRKAEVTLDDKEVGLKDIKKGQQAQIEYSSEKVGGKDNNKARNVNRALSVQVFGKGERNEGS